MIQPPKFFAASIAALLVSAHASLAHAVELGAVALDKSQVSFTSKQMGVPVEGTFKKFSAQLSFDPVKPETGKALVEIDTASVDAGSAEANEEVVGKNWFNVKQFPTAKFVSTGVKPLGNDRYDVSGKLTIRDKTRDVTIPFTLATQGGSTQFLGNFTIKRLDYDIGRGGGWDVDTVADEVSIKFKIAANTKK